MKMRKDKDFISFFNETTGHYVRSGIIKNGVESAEDPFMASFPELLDVRADCAYRPVWSATRTDSMRMLPIWR